LRFPNFAATLVIEMIAGAFREGSRSPETALVFRDSGTLSGQISTCATFLSRPAAEIIL
jgi:hypothetical protein